MNFTLYILLAVGAAFIAYLLGRGSRAGYISGLEEKLSDQKSKNAKRNASASDHKSKLNKLSGRYDKVLEERNAIKKELDVWQKKFDKKSGEYVELDSSYRKVKAELEDTKSTWESKLNTWNEERIGMESEHNTIMADWDGRYKASLTDKEEALKKLKEKNRRIDELNAILQARETRQESNELKWKKEQKELDRSIKEWKKKAIDFESKWKSQKQELASLKQELKTAGTQNEDQSKGKEKPQVVASEAPVAAEKSKAEKPNTGAESGQNKDDLTKIEGIGPKIQELLNADGILTYEDLAKTELNGLERILHDAGSRYKMHDPRTWAKQSSFCAKGAWDDLKTYQDELDGGREPSS